MQILIPDSWLREFLTTNATPKDIQRCLSLCGPSIERMHEKEGDYIYDIEVTTNRVDCMSVVGIAREAAAILPRFGFTAKLQNNPFTKTSNTNTVSEVEYLTVNIDTMLCPKFSAHLFTNIKVGKSPDWLTKKLELVGLRSLNNVVDITNYLTHELGQPVHVFDYDKIAKQTMTLRESRPGEQITTLDGKTHELMGGDIVIEDGTGSLIDLCGIMGGQNSAVDEQTTSVLLFVQNYEPIHIRKTSMTLAHRTTAAVLFEKSLPTESVLPTLINAGKHLKQLAGGVGVKDILDISAPEEINTQVTVSSPLTKYTNTRLGINLSTKEVKTILKDLGFSMTSETKITVPWYRKHDIEISEDLVEEIARIYGYHNLPTELMSGAIPTIRNDKQFNWITKIKYMLKYWGFTESYTYSLTSGPGIELKNPLSSEWSHLRTSLTPSHEAIIQENRGRVAELNFFEIANIYKQKENDLPQEIQHLILSSTNTNPLYLKGIMEAVLVELGISDYMFQTHLTNDTSIIEINLEEIIQMASTTKTYTTIAKFAPIIEDVNLELSKPYPQLCAQIYAISKLIQSIEVLDVYGQKVTLQITYHSTQKQLSSLDIAPIREKLASL